MSDIYVGEQLEVSDLPPGATLDTELAAHAALTGTSAHGATYPATIEGVSNPNGDINFIGSGVDVTGDNGVSKSVTITSNGRKIIGVKTSVTTTPYTVLSTDSYLHCTALASAMTIEAAPASDRTLTIKNRTTLDLTLTGANMDGESSVLIEPKGSRTIVWNGTDYDII